MANVCVITGGGSGMGLETARNMDKNVILVLTGRTVEKLEKAKALLESEGHEVHLMACDVSKRREVHELCLLAASLGTIMCTVARGQLMLQAQPENSMNYLKDRQNVSEIMSKIPLPLKTTMTDVSFAFTSRGTTCVSYANSRSFGPLDPYIREVFVLAEADAFDVQIEVACINGSFCLLFAQNFLSEVYFDAFVEELDEAAIPVEIIRKDQCPLSGVRFDGLEPDKQDILKNLMAGLFNISSIQK